LRLLIAFSRAIDAVNAFIGSAVSWAILLAVLVSAANAISRKAFSLASNAWLELQWYLFGAAFLLAAAYTLQRDEHIRIDIVSNALPKAVREWIDIIGHAFVLIPFTGLMIYECWPFFYSAWRSGEVSGSYGGLPLWPADLIILLGFVLLFFQAISELIKRLAHVLGGAEKAKSAEGVTGKQDQ
jgi:TRAP-type mannitol/chloroaromatic compound transport system permease small subunit